jgi:hypothetical protein
MLRRGECGEGKESSSGSKWGSAVELEGFDVGDLRKR